MVYSFQIPSDSSKNCFGEPNRSPLGLGWYEKFQAKHHQRVLEDWMRPYFPTEVTVKPSEHKLKDVIGTHLGFCVSQRVKDLIEAAEPDIHQFLPVTLNYGPDKFPYFMLKIGHSKDCYDLSRSDVEYRTLEIEGKHIEVWMKKHAKPMAFNAEKIGNMQLFQNASGFSMLLVSDSLHDSMTKNNISGLQFEKQNEA